MPELALIKQIALIPFTRPFLRIVHRQWWWQELKPAFETSIRWPSNHCDCRCRTKWLWLEAKKCSHFMYFGKFVLEKSVNPIDPFFGIGAQMFKRVSFYRHLWSLLCSYFISKLSGYLWKLPSDLCILWRLTHLSNLPCSAKVPRLSLFH